MEQREDRFRVEVSVGDVAVDVRVTGEIDIATVGAFRSALWAHPHRPVLRLDLSGVAVLSAAGVRALIAAHLGLRARGGELVLVDPHPMVGRVLRGAGLHRVIPVVPAPVAVLGATEALGDVRAGRAVGAPTARPLVLV